MHHIPKPQDQARVLKAALKNLDLNIKHQDALEVIAKVMGHKDWKTMAAVAETVTTIAAQVAPIQPAIKLLGPQGHDIYEATVTVDMTLSATVRVRAYDLEDAKTRLCSAACEQYPRGFELDEGNYRGSSDFYLGDTDAVTNLSELQVECDGDFFAKGTWVDEAYSYEVELSREEPDNADDDARAKVSLVLSATDSSGQTAKVYSDDYEIHGDLEEWLEDAFDQGDLDEHASAAIQVLLRRAQ